MSAEGGFGGRVRVERVVIVVGVYGMVSLVRVVRLARAVPVMRATETSWGPAHSP